MSDGLEKIREDLKTVSGFTDTELDRLESEFCKLPVFPDMQAVFFAVFVEGAAVQKRIQLEKMK
ncbi:hypothetical protein FH593_20415 (plasmid) [Leptospira interrogans]|uniref:hypothetical protein n=1 Tax=Leptospira interrogans TaxID=173 RepID=UPI0002BE33F1|nr:hypothetical protein [Leptospira interrogans]EMN60323.1 hypothetical protein LEP1GSC092_0040 [Leptospira interrogans serovar Pyrogenes str. R168]ULG90666.1 hypothetical protein FH593_20710 [Leptospira interrogans]ULG90695.1 hypothetical protein FH593_20415 [Leptospira interrogans]UML78405.1 hypothetical protein FH583_21680 [Leptospira interrogans]UML78461.1 hypothetical protein FH583_21530 [Leptospira interrogans]